MMQISNDFFKKTHGSETEESKPDGGNEKLQPRPESTLIDAVEATINRCAKAINTLEVKTADARKELCDLLTLKEELLNDKIPPAAQKFLFNHLEDNL